MQTIHQITRIRVLALLAFVVTLAGCAGWGAIDAAETTEQRAFATYGTFVVLQEQAAEMIQNPRVPAGVKRRIQQIDARAKPVADQTLELALEVTQIRRAVEAGEDDAAKLRIAVDNLDTYVERLQPLMADLLATIREG